MLVFVSRDVVLEFSGLPADSSIRRRDFYALSSNKKRKSIETEQKSTLF